MSKKKEETRLSLIEDAIKNLKPEVELLELQVRYYLANNKAMQIEKQLNESTAKEPAIEPEKIKPVKA